MLNYCNIAKQCMVVANGGLVERPWSTLSSVEFLRIAYLPRVEKVTVFVKASTALVNKVPQKPCTTWKCGDKVVKTKVRSALFTYTLVAQGESAYIIM